MSEEAKDGLTFLECCRWVQALHEEEGICVVDVMTDKNWAGERAYAIPLKYTERCWTRALRRTGSAAS